MKEQIIYVQLCKQFVLHKLVQESPRNSQEAEEYGSGALATFCQNLKLDFISTCYLKES